MMKELTIGEVAAYARIQTSAIRYYEREGLLPAPKRVNGRRRYDLSVLKRLGLIQLARQAGFGIRELQTLFDGSNSNPAESSQWQTLATEKIAEMDRLIKQTQAIKGWLEAALRRDCRGVDDCISISIDENENDMRVTLLCETEHTDHSTDAREVLKLLIMESHSES